MNIYSTPYWLLPSEHFFGELRAVELRFNPYHSPINGRFCSKDMLDAGGGTNSSESIDKSQKSGIIKSSEDFSYISATGPNEFEKGFSYNNLVNHWYGNDNPKISSHKKEYEDRGYDMEGAWCSASSDSSPASLNSASANTCATGRPAFSATRS